MYAYVYYIFYIYIIFSKVKNQQTTQKDKWFQISTYTLHETKSF